MANLIKLFMYNLTISISLIFVWHNFINKKLDFKNYKLYILLILITIVSVILCMLDSKVIKIVLLIIIFGFFVKYIFNADFTVCVLLPIYYEFIIMISETLYH